MAYIDPYEEEQERQAELELDAQLRRQGMPDPEIRRPSAMSPYAETAPVAPASEPLSVPMGEAAPALVALAQSMEREASAPALANESARDVSGRMHTGLSPEQASGMRAGYDAIATPRERSALPEQAPPPPQNALEAFAAQGLVGPASGTRLSPGQRMALASRPTPEMQREQALKALADKRAFELQKIQAAHPVKPPSELDSARAAEARAKAAKIQAELDRRRSGGVRAALPRGTEEGVDAQVQALVDMGMDPGALAGIASTAKTMGKRGQKARDKLLSMYSGAMKGEAAEARRREAEARKRANTGVKKSAPQQKKEMLLNTEKAELQSLLARLKQRDPDSRLPGSTGALGRAYRSAEESIIGTSGLSDEDQSLETALDSAGLSSYTSRANNAPNSEAEQDLAKRFYRGSGRVSGAILEIENRLEAIDREARAMSGAPPSKAGDGMPTTDGQRTHTYRVTTPSGTSTKQLTPDQARHLDKKGFAVEPI